MANQTLTTDRGILHVGIDEDCVLLGLSQDDGEVHIIEIPTHKFAAIVEAFNAEATK
jgi:hypothetical protein